MPLDPRTPVLVGVGAVVHRDGDADPDREPLELMHAAVERAADDAGSRALLAHVDAIRAPRGFWDYADPCRQLAERLGVPSARTEVAEIGVLQTTLVGRAAADIAAGRAGVVVIAGAEDRRRAQRARRAGAEPRYTRRPELVPDVVLRPEAEILHDLELQAGLAMPVGQYAIIENALRAAEGTSVAAHLDALAALSAEFSAVAARNPDAWSREAVTAEAVRGAPMLAFPYTARHTSQWTVDQGAALILCPLELAERLGVPRAKRVFPLAVADADFMLPLVERRVLHASPGFALAAAQACARVGCEPSAVEHLDLYSCFPSAVRVQRRELGIPAGRPLTVTGGMAFAGGPLNSYVLHALVAMARVLRDDPGSRGLVTAVSGILTKQGVSLWSSEPGAVAFAHDDVSAASRARTARVEVVADAAGAATVASYTVLHERGEPAQLVLVCDLADGRRTLRVVRDAGRAAAATRTELCARPVVLAPDGDVDGV